MHGDKSYIKFHLKRWTGDRCFAKLRGTVLWESSWESRESKESNRILRKITIIKRLPCLLRGKDNNHKCKGEIKIDFAKSRFLIYFCFSEIISNPKAGVIEAFTEYINNTSLSSFASIQWFQFSFEQVAFIGGLNILMGRGEKCKIHALDLHVFECQIAIKTNCFWNAL